MPLLRTLLKSLLGLMAGAVIGFALALGAILLLTDTTASDFLHNFASVDLWRMLLAVAVSIASLILSASLLVIAHEAGHLVCGLLTGYHFVSFRIFSFTFIRLDGHLRVKRYSVAGTGGQCLLAPPDCAPSSVPWFWYNAGGVLANILLFLVVLPLMWLHLHPLLYTALAVFLLVDAFFIIVNGVPMKAGGVGNDAYNILLLRRSMLSRRALMVQLRSNAMIQNGVRPKDMPDEWFEYQGDVDYANALEVALPMMSASRLIDMQRFDEAYQAFSELYRHKDALMGLYVNEIACELAYAALVTGRTDEAAVLLTPELRRYICAYSGVMSSKQRLRCAITLILDHDRSGAEQIYRDLLSSRHSYLLQGEIDSDLALLSSLLR